MVPSQQEFEEQLLQCISMVFQEGTSPNKLELLLARGPISFIWVISMSPETQGSYGS
jgi:hypothetical protein